MERQTDVWWVKATRGEAHQAILEIAVRKGGRNQAVVHEAFLGSLLLVVLYGMH